MRPDFAPSEEMMQQQNLFDRSDSVSLSSASVLGPSPNKLRRFLSTDVVPSSNFLGFTGGFESDLGGEAADLAP